MVKKYLGIGAVFAVLCLLPAAELTFSGAAYWWHRIRGKDAESALKPFRGWKIYALTAEIRRNRPPVLLSLFPGAVPVIRLDQFCWRTPGFLNSLLAVLNRLPEGEVQLDCDVPEAKIQDYAGFLKQLNCADTRHVFSITLLPCHLKHRELREVLSGIKYAVLQLHALELPCDLPQEYRLFDLAAADRAIQAMRHFSVPFRIALPSYAYTIHYTEDGKFRRMSAENEPPPQKKEIRKMACPDWHAVQKLRRKYPSLQVIWFRLPKPGDRLILEAENLLRLNRGELPRKEVEIVTKKNGKNTDIYWKNHGFMGRVYYSMKLGGRGETFFFNGVSPDRQYIPGIVPHAVRGMLPPPGETMLAVKILNLKNDKND